MSRRQSGGREGEVCIPLSCSPYHQAPRYARGYSGTGVPPWCVAVTPQLLSVPLVLLCQTWHCLQMASTQPGSPAQSWPWHTEVPVCPDQNVHSCSASTAFNGGNLQPILKSRLKGILENLASPLHSQALSTALSWVFGLKNICN